MAPNLFNNNTAVQSRNMRTALIMGFALIAVMLLPDLALAQPAASGFGETGQKVCGFFSSINGILNMTSILVVTVAVVFSGYQIAFAHKRIADVAPVLIGGVIIGAASQVANMVIGSTPSTQCQSATAMLMHYVSMRYA